MRIPAHAFPVPGDPVVEHRPTSGRRQPGVAQPGLLVKVIGEERAMAVGRPVDGPRDDFEREGEELEHERIPRRGAHGGVGGGIEEGRRGDLDGLGEIRDVESNGGLHAGEEMGDLRPELHGAQWRERPQDGRRLTDETEEPAEPTHASPSPARSKSRSFWSA